MIKKRVIQQHHISYNPEITIPIFRGEHQILTLLKRYCSKTVSLSFINALEDFIQENKVKAVDLSANNR